LLLSVADFNSSEGDCQAKRWKGRTLHVPLTLIYIRNTIPNRLEGDHV
jgi:hypothetical protein